MHVPALVSRDPKFGWDPWKGPGTPVESHEEFAAQIGVELGVGLYSGADTLGGAIGLMPSGLDAYFSYVDNFGGWGELVARFGSSVVNNHPFLCSITIFGNPARCADVEPGAMHVSSVAPWLDDGRGLADSISPAWVYTSAGNWSTVNSVVGGRRIIRWSAHYGFGPHVCGPRTCGYPQADWTQWTDVGPAGQNFDRSIGTWLPSTTPPPPPPPPEATMSIATEKNFDGRLEAVVLLETGQALHRWQNTAGGDWVTGWHGLGDPGKGSIALGLNKSGRLEAIVHREDGQVVHTWQTTAGGVWEGEDAHGQGGANWFDLGNPGK